MTAKTISMTAAGLRLRLSYSQVLRLVLLGKIEGKLKEGRWQLDRAAVQRFAQQRGQENAEA